jgi:hypothetical protein
MKKIIVLCMVFCVSSFLFSYEYIMNSNPTGIGSHTGSTKITTLTGGNWDDGYADLAIPAANQFYYYGKLVTTLRISTNGYVVLGKGAITEDGTDYANGSLPDPSIGLPNNIVAPLWDDYWLSQYPNGAGDIYYSFVTNANNNNYISIEWRGVERRGAGDSAVYSFAVGLCSKNNCYRPNTVIIAINDVDTGNPAYDNGVQATVGIENSTGTIGELYSYNQAIVTSGLRITFTPFVPIYGSTTDTYESVDDSYPDAILFRPSNGHWYYYNSSGTTRSWVYGQKGDIALPGDYDGDGDSDELVFRPNNGKWFCSAPSLSKTWGVAGDIPVPADYDGDGKLDIAVFRPSAGKWYIYYLGTSTSTTVIYGTVGDIPLPADYDGDGLADPAVYRPSNNKWYIRKSTDSTTIAKLWGAEGDVPMPSNFASYSSSVSVFRPSTGWWYALDPMGSDTYKIQWGQDGDVPVPGDENAGGLTDATVFRPATNAKWFLSYHTHLPGSFVYGTLGDKPRFHQSNLIVSPPPSQDKH